MLLVLPAVVTSLLLTFHPFATADDYQHHAILKRAILGNGPLLLPQSWDTNNNLIQQLGGSSSSSSSGGSNGRFNDVGSSGVVYDPNTGYSNNPSSSVNRPIYFGQSLYSFSLTSCVTGSYVGSVNAISIGGGQIQYTLQQTNGFSTSAFAIDAYTGQITLTGPFNAAQQAGSTTTLYVQATDSRSGSTAQTTVTVYASCNGNGGGGNPVTYDPNTSYINNPPTYYYPPSSTNFNPTLTYYYPSYSTSSDTGVIYDPNTGYQNYPSNGGSSVIYDPSTSYYNNPSSASNNRQPYYPQSYYTFYDTSCSPNGFIGNVQATDPDNDNIQYSIVYNSGAGYYNGAYKIDPSTGYITRSSGYGSGSTTFQVLANDLRGRSATATVTIQSQCSGYGGGSYPSFGFG